MAMVIDLSLKSSIYAGCEIEEVAGRLNLTTKVDQAISIVGRNANGLEIDPEKVELTGPMAVWAYLIVFHAVVHRTREVWYNDGRGCYLVAKHG